MILTYDRSSARYRDFSTGRFISRNATRHEVQRIVDHTSRQVDKLTISLRNGEISVFTWQNEMKDTLRASHTLAAQIAGGGKAQMNNVDWLHVARAVKPQYAALNRFALQIEAGASISLGRARMYAKAVLGTFANFEAVRAEQAGYATAIWHTTANESCAGCAAAAGSYPMGTQPELQSHQCLTNCLCFLTFE